MNSAPWLIGTHLGVLAVGLAGFFALALATERHAEHLLGRALGRTPSPRWRWLARIAGWLLLAASLAWAVGALGAGIGITLWLGWLSVAALVLVFAFPHWPWSLPQREKPVRAAKAGANAPPMPAPPRWRRRLAAGLLVATAGVFAVGLAGVETKPLTRPDALQGRVGPWDFTLAETRRDAPEVMEMDVPMKEFRLRFCDACDNEIRQAFLKVHKPRSARAVGMAFMGQRWERRVEIPLPATTRADSELWLTVEGKDGRVHQTALRMAQASPATVAWFDAQRKRHGQD